MTPRLLSFLAIVAIAAPAHSQAVTGEARTSLLTAARAQYYNLRFQGLKSFSCNVAIDWDSIFTQATGAPLPADNPIMAYLLKTRLGVKETVDSGAEVTWANSGTPPDALAQSVSQLRGGVKQMLDGFFEAWTPNINGDLFSKGVTSVTATNAGYQVEEKSEKNSTDTLTFDKNMLLGHISSTSPEVLAEIDTKYSPTPQGLLVSSFDADYRQPVSAPPTHVTMTTDYQKVEGFQLPNTIVLSVRNVATFKLKLTGCTVEKLPK